MAEMLKYDTARGAFDCIIRNDAVKLRNPERWFVPTSERTRWVNSWDEFLAAGGIVYFSEDQAQIELLLPEPYKFSIRFNQNHRDEFALQRCIEDEHGQRD